MVAAWLLERVGFRQQIDRVRDVVALVGLGALLSMTISATIGSAALVMSSGIPAGGFWSRLDRVVDGRRDGDPRRGAVPAVRADVERGPAEARACADSRKRS
jgi:hypothetical protein